MGAAAEGVVGAVGQFLTWTGNTIFGTQRKTFTDIQIENILTKGVEDTNARRKAYRGAQADSQAYTRAYSAFRRQYKKTFRETTFRNLGYLPSSSATTRVISNSLVKSYLQSTLGYVDVEVVNAADEYPRLNERCLYGRQQLVGYDFVTGKLVNDGKTYSFTSCEAPTAESVLYGLTRDADETIVQNLTDNYAYDGTTVTIGSEVYEVSVLNAGIVDGEYTTVCVHPTLPDEVITTPVETITRSYSNTLFDEFVTFISYRVLSGEIDTATRYLMVVANTLPIYSTEVIQVSPIITLKQDFTIVDPTRKTLKQAMKRFGMGADQFVSTLSQEDIHSAYTTVGVDPTVNTPSHAKTVFQMFDLVSAGSGNIVITITNLNMTYSFTMVKRTVVGSIGAVGTYTKSLAEYLVGCTTDSEGGSDCSYDTRMVLRYQGSETQYREIEITNFLLTYTVAGRANSATLDDGEGGCRLIIPLDLLNSLRYNDWVEIYESSLCLIVYAQKTVELDWYQQDWFFFVVRIVGIALMFIPGLQAVGAGLITLTQFAINLLINIVIAMVMMAIANWIAEATGSDLAGAIAMLIMLYVAYTYNIMPPAGEGGSAWMQSAVHAISTTNQFVQHRVTLETQELERDQQKHMDAMNEKLAHIYNYLEENKSEPYRYAERTFRELERSGSPNPVFQSIEAYVNSIVNTEYIVDGTWMYDIEGQIESRNKVYVG